MTDAKPSSLTGRHKAFLAGGIIVALAGTAAIVLLRPGASSWGLRADRATLRPSVIVRLRHLSRLPADAELKRCIARKT